MKRLINIGRAMRIVAVIAVFLAAVVCARADRLVESTWDTGLDGWVASGSAAVTNTSGYLEVIFPAQTAPEYSAESLAKNITKGYRPNHISFSIRAPELVPSVIRIYLQSSSGRSWYKSFIMPATNELVSFNAVVSYESGWILGPISSQDDFNSDMDAIQKVSLHLVRNGTRKEHSFEIDDFVVDAVQVGTPLPEDNDGDGMLDSWELAYGLDPGDASDALADADSDGLNNHDEYVAGTDPMNAASVFEVQMPSDMNNEEGFVTLAWNSVEGRFYQVWKSTNLVSGFFMLEGGIRATPPVNFYMDELEESERTIFYKIKIE